MTIIRTLFLAASTVSSLFLVACRAAKTGGLVKCCAETGLAAPTPLAEAGLPNFGRVDDGLFRSGQPTRAGLLEARRLGVRTVVNLRSAHTEDAVCAEAGLDYVRIPMQQWKTTDEDVARFLRVATDPACRPVLIHCAQGQDRTGVLVAAYRRVVEGWSASDAVRELESYGACPIWSNLRSYIEHLDVERMKGLVASMPLPPTRGAEDSFLAGGSPRAPATMASPSSAAR